MPLQLPDFPWDELGSARQKAAAHPEGLIDLSVGSPVDPTPELAQVALANAANSPGYPTAFGSARTRGAMSQWWRDVRGASSVDAESVMPTVGSKEMVGLLPLLLGLGRGDTIVIPEIAYPTYDVGGQLVGATVVAEDDPSQWPDSAKLVWINTPSNPTGSVLGVEYLRAAVSRARGMGAVLVSDECYALLGSAESPQSPSLLTDEVTDGNLEGLLALYSLSKQSNLAGYRAAMVAGDPALIQNILLPRRHLGLLVPEPIQQVLAAVLADTESVTAMRETYQRRRAVLHQALASAGWSINGGEAGLYLWASQGSSSVDAVDWFARHGILVAPGHFYGPGGARHVRVALTASDEDISRAAERISS
jgi:succinyldiaminopimelate transaminase